MTARTSKVCSHCLRLQHDHCTVGEACGCEVCNPPLVVWEDPPPRAGSGAVSPVPPAALEELRAHPKRWARVKEYPSSSGANTYAANVTKGKVRALPPDEWEAVARREGKGSILYLRFKGEPIDAANRSEER